MIYLKVDTETAPRFEAEGCGPFEYGTKTGRRAIASYRKLPDRLYDDHDELVQWAEVALSVARRSGTDKRKQAQSSKKKMAKPKTRSRRPG